MTLNKIEVGIKAFIIFSQNIPFIFCYHNNKFSSEIILYAKPILLVVGRFSWPILNCRQEFAKLFISL